MCDNMSITSIAHNPIIHERIKHMELDLFFVREKVLIKQLKVIHIPDQSQKADILTNALPTSRFEELRSKLTMCDSAQITHNAS